MDTERKTIFLVDDDLINLTLGKKALADTYNVFTLNSAQVMFSMLENLMPDLIVMDVNMPGMDGYEAIKKLREDSETAAIPVVFLTALTMVETELEGFSLGAVDYIHKPFSAPLLLKRLAAHLLLEDQKRQLFMQQTELLLLNNNLEQLVNEKTATVVELKNAILSVMAELVEFRDEITGGHIIRTQRYIESLMSAMLEKGVYYDEISGYDEELVIQSCQLHDVGKISVSDAILNKPGRLTPEEFEVIKTHPTFGEKIINRLKEKTSDSDFLEYAKVFAVTHHEKWDGSGYPAGLSGTDIPLLGRMMAIADVYDALVEERPYKKAFSHEKAAAIIIEGRGGHFDPLLTDLFAEIHTEFERILSEVNG